MLDRLRPIWQRFLLAFKPLFVHLIPKDAAKLATIMAAASDPTGRGMVTEFNIFHRLIFRPMFRRVQVLQADIDRIRDLSATGPIVFVMKNRGQLEYRFFNYLFLKEGISLIRYATNALTLFWWPLKQLWAHLLMRLASLYEQGRTQTSVEERQNGQIVKALEAGHNVLINLSVSRDYLFGLVKTSPLDALRPLIDLQGYMSQPVRLVSLQFHYDRHPDRTRKSLFDLMFGEKSQPGALRKCLLFFLSFTRDPAVKFGAPINLKEFLSEANSQDRTTCTQKLFSRIEDDLRIEHARISGPALKSKAVVISELLADKEFQKNLEEIAMVRGLPQASVEREAKRYLEEIVADVSYSVVDFLDWFLTWLWNSIFDGLVYNREGLDRIRDAAGRHPVVLVPMHRSHLDYLLISYIFYNEKITFPHICAGLNLNFWPVGRFIRKAGGFFIRRSFSGNTTYKETLATYMRSLMAANYCVEFFIEGTRSRTGKLLKPKMGALSLLMKAYFDGSCEDIRFVPIAVSYDQIPEQKAYRAESSGAEKTKENAGELLKVRKAFLRKYGKVYIQFGEPISLKDWCEASGVAKVPLETLKQDVSDFAYHLTYNINKEAVITPMALLATALLSFPRKSASRAELNTRINSLESYLRYKQARLSDVLRDRRDWAMDEALGLLVTKGIIQRHDTFNGTVFSVDDVRRGELDYYKNTILHFYVSLSCVAKIVSSLSSGESLSLAELVRQFETLKTIFRADFTFSHRKTLEEHVLRAAQFLVGQGAIRLSKDTLTRLDHSEGLQAYASLLDNFLEAHLAALRYIKAQSFVRQDKKTLIKDMLEKLKPLFLTGEFRFSEALSQFNLENALSTLTDVGVLTTDEPEKGRVLYSLKDAGETAGRWMDLIQSLLAGTPQKLAMTSLNQPLTALSTHTSAADTHDKINTPV